MSTLLEDPLPAIVCGVFAEFVLLVVLWRTGRGMVLGWMAGTAFLTGALVLIEHLVVTDHEQIETAMESLRAAVEANDADAALELISPAAQDARKFLSTSLRRYRFSQVRILDQQISFDSGPQPNAAQVAASGIVLIADHSGANPIGQFGGAATVHFQRIDGRWLLTDVTDLRQAIPGLPPKKGERSSKSPMHQAI